MYRHDQRISPADQPIHACIATWLPRYGQDSGSGSNEPKRNERKEQRPDWKPRQGGDQTRGDEDRLEPPIEPEEREKVR